MPRVLFFPKLERFETSLYMYGWGGAITDADSILTPVWRNLRREGCWPRTTTAAGSNDKFDALAAQQAIEAGSDQARGRWCAPRWPNSGTVCT